MQEVFMNMGIIASLLHTAHDEFEVLRTVQCRRTITHHQKQCLLLLCEIVQETQWHFDKREHASQAVTYLDSEGTYVICSTFYVRDTWVGRIRLQTIAGDSVLLLEENVRRPAFLRHVVDTCLVEAAWQQLKCDADLLRP